MYNISHFKANHESEVLTFMRDNPFAIICGVDENLKPIATQVPVLFEERDGKLILLAHIMRNQLHSKAFEKNSDVLVIFNSNSTYISAKNYQQQNTASTWNYQTVHANGVLKFVDDEMLYNILSRLTHQFENDENSPSSFNKLDKNYVKEHSKAIIGFEIEVTEIQHVFKMSQNKDDETKHKIIRSLIESNDHDKIAFANKMKKFFKF